MTERTSRSEIVRDGSKKVKDVCIDFRTREDEALAMKLQDEEFETHYLRNRKERGTARVDVRTAKETYLEEVKKAGLLKDAEYQRLAEDDAWLAAELQQRLDEEEKMETEKRAAGEMQDEEYAYYLQQKEKERLEKVRHHRLQKRIERERKEFDKIEQERLVEGAAVEERIPAAVEGRRPITDIDQPFPDSHESTRERDVSRDIGALRVSMPEADDRNGTKENAVEESEYLAKEQELKDEEYARQLQRKEQEKLQKMMEERDRRLAMKMQRKEADEYRRERAERQMRKAASMQAKVDLPPSNSETDLQRESTEPIHADARVSMERRSSEQRHVKRPEREEKRSFSVDHTASIHQANETKERQRVASLSRGDKIEEHHHEAVGMNSNENLERIPNDSTASIDARDKPFVNVAACIDPTYKGDDEETPHWTERRWGLDDTDPQGKPAPVIQNTKRKKSGTKNAKNDKCKQQ